MHDEIDLVFWQNTLSAHQAPLIRSLSDRRGMRILVVTDRGPGEDRMGLGWDKLDYGGARLLIGPATAQRAEIVERTRDAVAHVFSGLGAYPRIEEAHRALSTKSSSTHLAAITESWDPRGPQGALRGMRFRRRVRRNGGRIDTLFAIGALARTQFERIGIPAETIKPFAYAVDGYASDKPAPRDDFSRLVFVGALTELKNPSLLLSALGALKGRQWTLTLVGKGPMRARLEAEASRHGIANRVRFTGGLSSDESRYEIANADLLILTSRYDGWGAVVNEALMSGTPALVSMNAGASELIARPVLGDVFASGRVGSLIEVLEPRLAGPLDPASRLSIKDWATVSISADAMADYMLDRLTGSRAQASPPWSVHRGGAST